MKFKTMGDMVVKAGYFSYTESTPNQNEKITVIFDDNNFKFKKWILWKLLQLFDPRKFFHRTNRFCQINPQMTVMKIKIL